MTPCTSRSRDSRVTSPIGFTCIPFKRNVSRCPCGVTCHISSPLPEPRPASHSKRNHHRHSSVHQCLSPDFTWFPATAARCPVHHLRLHQIQRRLPDALLPDGVILTWISRSLSVAELIRVVLPDAGGGSSGAKVSVWKLLYV